VVNDDPTTFNFHGQQYNPGNFGHYYGELTIRRALATSDNIATVSVAEQIGYDKIAKLAWSAGFNDKVQGTPSIALGAYETSALELAGGYTVFANGGTYVRPRFLRSTASVTRPVLSPAVAFLVQDMLAEVIRSGTGAGIWSTGFRAPAAGKTGTSRDGWFAGFVSNLICVVWVGYDDNTDLKLEGALSALPVWAEFMKRASERSVYDQPLRQPPSGVVSASIDAESGLLAGPRCEHLRTEFFLYGTVPTATCERERPQGIRAVSSSVQNGWHKFGEFWSGLAHR